MIYNYIKEACKAVQASNGGKQISAGDKVSASDWFSNDEVGCVTCGDGAKVDITQPDESCIGTTCSREVPIPFHIAIAKLG